MPGVTISAATAQVAVSSPRTWPKLLGFPLLDRAISSHVADQLHVSVRRLKAVQPAARCPIASSAPSSRWPPG